MIAGIRDVASVRSQRWELSVRSLLRLIAVSQLFVVANCGGDAASPAGPSNPEAVSVTIAPATHLLGIRGVTRFSAIGQNAAGQPVSSPAFEWSTLDPSIATIDGGVARALASGSARIVVRLGALADTAILTVLSIFDLSGSLALQGVVVEPYALNGSGVVVGSIAGPSGGTPFLMVSGGEPVPLPLPAGRATAFASGVSDAGLIVGGTGDLTSGRALLWTPLSNATYTLTELPLSGGASGAARGISPSGQFISGVIYIELAPNNFGGYPVRWVRAEGGGWSVQRIPVPEGLFGDATSVNDAGDVVGLYGHPATGFQAARWTMQSGVWVTENLGALGGESTVALDINSSGVIVGQWNSIAVRWIKTAGIWEERRIFPAADLIEGSFASGINDRGDIIGAFVKGGQQQAFRWSESSGAELLGSLLASGAARAINMTGAAVGISFDPADISKRLGTLWPAK